MRIIQSESSEVLLTTLNKGVAYWYAIDSFNESGVTQGGVCGM